MEGVRGSVPERPAFLFSAFSALCLLLLFPEALCSPVVAHF